MTDKIGEAFCSAEVIEAGGIADNLTVRMCSSCGTVWGHDPNVGVLQCPFCLTPADYP